MPPQRHLLQGRIQGGGAGVRTPPPHFGPRCRLFNIGTKVGSPPGPPFLACRPIIPPPFQKSWIRPCPNCGVRSGRISAKPCQQSSVNNVLGCTPLVHRLLSGLWSVVSLTHGVLLGYEMARSSRATLASTRSRRTSSHRQRTTTARLIPSDPGRYGPTCPLLTSRPANCLVRPWGRDHVFRSGQIHYTGPMCLAVCLFHPRPANRTVFVDDVVVYR